MVLVTARVPVRLEQREAVLALLGEVQAASRLDDGCESYAYYESIDEPGVFSAIEMWRDREALTEHLKTDHVRRLVEAVRAHAAAAPEIVAHDVRSSGPLPL